MSDYERLKRAWGDRVRLCAMGQKRLPPCAVTFVHIEPNRKRDPDNVCAGAAKVILDGLISAGVLAGDGWRDILDLRHHWTVDAKRPGVVIYLGPRAYERSELGISP